MEQKKTISKKQQASVAKYVKSHYDEIKLRVPKGERERIQKYAESKGESVNSFVYRAICEAITNNTERVNGTQEA